MPCGPVASRQTTKDLARDVRCLQTKLKESEKGRREAERRADDLEKEIALLKDRMSTMWRNLKEKDDLLEAMLSKIDLLTQETMQNSFVSISLTEIYCCT